MTGQRGGIGSTLIKYLNGAHGETIERIALGTNAICQTSSRAHCIVGPVTSTWANAILGEVTPNMAETVMTSLAFKLLLPLFQEKGEIIGVVSEPLPHLVQTLVEKRLTEVRDHV